MPLQPGDVIRVWDRQVRPPKPKWLICVDPPRQLFLRINSKPLFQPHHLLRAADCGFLKWDSYVELRQLVRPYAYEIAQADLLGSIAAHLVPDLLEAAERSEVLSQEFKDRVREGLSRLLR